VCKKEYIYDVSKERTNHNRHQHRQRRGQ
jgi:hypothetical protein